MQRLLAIVAFSTALFASPGFAVTSTACATGGKMVEAFAMLRDQHKPIADVDAYIDKLPGIDGDKQQSDFYKKLARATYSQQNLTPPQARDSFVEFCSSVPAR